MTNLNHRKKYANPRLYNYFPRPYMGTLLNPQISALRGLHTIHWQCKGGRPIHHAGCAPDVCRCAVASANEHLQGAVLPGLDVFCKVLVLFWERDFLFIYFFTLLLFVDTGYDSWQMVCRKIDKYIYFLNQETNRSKKKYITQKKKWYHKYVK